MFVLGRKKREKRETEKKREEKVDGALILL